MISKIDICNMALAQIGQEPIASLEQDNEAARRCHLFYDSVRQEVLRTHYWAFACGQAALAVLVDPEQTAEPYQYAYPQDCLFVRKVYEKGRGQRPVPFKEVYRQDLQARTIQCAVPQAQIEYTRDVRDESLFDPAFVKAFSLALATDLAQTLTADTALAQRILQKYTLALDEARRSNMSEEFALHQGESAFVESR